MPRVIAARVYIAGPMTGIEDFNFPAFHAAAKAWRGRGWIVINPADAIGGDTSLPYAAYIRIDIRHVLDDVDAIAVLPGWQASRGAAVEVALGRLLGYPIFDAETFAEIAA